MSIKEKILGFLLSPFPQRFVGRRRRSPIEIIRKYSRGNVRLQLGKVMFDDEFQQLKAKVVKYAF